jgi:hypothetical protein
VGGSLLEGGEEEVAVVFHLSCFEGVLGGAGLWGTMRVGLCFDSVADPASDFAADGCDVVPIGAGDVFGPFYGLPDERSERYLRSAFPEAGDVHEILPFEFAGEVVAAGWGRGGWDCEIGFASEAEGSGAFVEGGREFIDGFCVSV